MSFFSSISKIIQGDTRVWTRDLSQCSRMLYHWAVSPLHTDSIISLQTRSGCLSIVTMFFVPRQVYSRDQCHFFLVFQILYKRSTRVRTRDLSDCSRLLYYWAIPPLHTDSIPSLQTRACCLSTYNVFCSESSVLSRLMSFFSSLSKIIQADTRVRTRDLSDCSRLLYHWAISALHSDSIPSLQTRAGCLSTVTMFFVSSQVFSRDRCHFSLVFQKLYKGTPGFEPGTSRTAAEGSNTELYPAAYSFNKITANTCRLFENWYNIFCSESSVLSRLMSFFSSLSKIIQEDTRFQTRDLWIAAESSTTELYPRCIQIQ